VKEQVGIFGATGYTGREVVRLISTHPSLQVAFKTGAGHLSHEAGLEEVARAYLLCLPHGVSGRFAGELRSRYPQAVIVDLSGDLRLPSVEEYRAWYGEVPPAPSLLGTTPYGLTEVFRERIRGAPLVANPGCYATSVLLPMVPLLHAGLVAGDDILVDAKSGASGAGRTLREDLLFCEVAEDIAAYQPGRSHRHVGEIEAVLLEQTGARIGLTFCPHLLPVKRGILSTLYLKTAASVAELRAALERFYRNAPFVHVVGAPPRLGDVVGTNFCHVSVHPGAPGRAVVFSALDNLLKGAAGQAVQNLNVALGWDETLGLLGGAP
jgi:N-acetyl-gamma-glutamyl-phosphate reductase